MSDYGVTPLGFTPKRLPILIGEIEAATRAVFGADVIQTPQSPLGQLNGLYADLAATLWEIALDTYQSADPDQAEGVRLEALARLRNFTRATGETDADFRRDITNKGRARTDVADILGALRSLPGVSQVRAFVNDTGRIDANGIDSHSLAFAIIGGDDQAIAQAIRRYTVPGVGTYGNVPIDTLVDGMCRTVYILRPVEVRARLQVKVRVRYDANGNPPPAPAAIEVGLAEEFSRAKRPANGVALDDYQVRSRLEPKYPSQVEFVSGMGAIGDGPFVALPLPILFNEIVSLALADIEVIPV